MSWRTDTDWFTTPVPPGWPGDDPTVPDDVEALGVRPRPVRRSERGPRRRLGLWAARPAVRGEVDDLDDLGRVDVDGGHRVRASHRVDRVDTGLGAMQARATGPGIDVRRAPRRPARDDQRDPPHEAPSADDGYDDDHGDDDVVAGVQPAGRALVIMVATLVLAMLVNADALVERAEQQPPGDGRDRSLAVWHPVQDVSHVLQLHRVRQLADWLAGNDGTTTPAPASGRDARRAPGAPHERDESNGANDDPTSRDSDEHGAAEGATDEVDDGADGGASPPAADAGQVRTPTADDPLTMWIGGDSMAELMGPSLAGTAEATGLVDATVHYEMASGLTRPDYYDWPAALADDLAEHEPEIVVIVLGANDGQGIVADGTPVQQVSDPAWSVEYRRRVGALMDDLRADGRMVLWLGQPPMREPDYAARLAVVNQAFAQEAESRPWVTYVDPAASLGDEAGGYADTRPDADGAPVEVRRPDGIYLTAAGADLLAGQVFDALTTRVDLAGDDGADD